MVSKALKGWGPGWDPGQKEDPGAACDLKPGVPGTVAERYRVLVSTQNVPGFCNFSVNLKLLPK